VFHFAQRQQTSKRLGQESHGILRSRYAASPGDYSVVAPGMFYDWRAQGTSLEGLAAYTNCSLNFTGGIEPERIDGLRMLANGLQLLRALRAVEEQIRKSELPLVKSM
jgi:hypothetical protein